MWWEDAVVYQIYPLGLCGAPAQNSGGEARPRIRQLLGWVQHIKSLGAGAVLAMTRAIILRWTRALAQTKILPLCAKQFTARA